MDTTHLLHVTNSIKVAVIISNYNCDKILGNTKQGSIIYELLKWEGIP